MELTQELTVYSLIPYCIIPAVAVIVVTINVCILCFPRLTFKVPAYNSRKKHRWCHIGVFLQAVYCSVSGNHINEGLYCDCCGICVSYSLDLIREADTELICKVLTSCEDKNVHHWIRGNLPLCSVCDVCGETCGVLPQLCDLRCVWCQRTVHDNCVHNVFRFCDLGSNSSMIVPPNCVKLEKVGIKSNYIVSRVSEPPIRDWHPLIVIANSKSGNNDGNDLFHKFRTLLHPLQVIDINRVKPERGLEWCRLLPDTRLRVLVCGGDGTIGCVLSAIDKLNLRLPPEVAILPLGTGNDLSRVLGWGPGYTADVQLNDVLKDIKTAEAVLLDRWKVSITYPKRYGMSRMTKELVMNSYMSVGVDALVCMKIHKQRKSWPKLFGSRIFNKMWYMTYGTKDVLERQCKNLHQKLKLTLDGQEQKLPELEGVVILNISSWGGGCEPWLIQSQAPSEGHSHQITSFSDGLFEVMGIYSSFHCAQMQNGLAEPLRIGQAKHIEMEIRLGKVAMQVDGEPWELESPASLDISHHNTACMLSNTTDTDMDTDQSDLEYYI